MALQQRRLVLAQERERHDLRRRRQAQVEQVDHGGLARHDDGRLAEVDLRLGTRARGGPTIVTSGPPVPSSAAEPTHDVADGRLRDLRVVLLDEALPDPPRGVALLARRLPVAPPATPGRAAIQGPITGDARAGLARGGGTRRRQRLAHGPAMDPVAAGQGADGQPFLPMVDTDTLEQLHPRQPLLPTSEPSTVPSMGSCGVGGGASSDDHCCPKWGQFRLSLPGSLGMLKPHLLRWSHQQGLRVSRS